MQNADKLLETCDNVTQFLRTEDVIFPTIVQNLETLKNSNMTFENYFVFMNDTYNKIYTNFSVVKDTMLKVILNLVS